MKTTRSHIFTAVFSCMAVVPAISHAAVIVNQTTVNISGNGRVPGQSFTTSNDGIADFLTEATFGKGFLAVASGELFLLGQEYLGIPTALTTLTPGYLAKSAAVTNAGLNAIYTFTGINQFTLQPNTKYWLYSNAATGWDLEWSDHDAYSGGNLYMALPTGSSPENTFGSSANPTTVDYRFSVSATSVPEPAACTLLGLGMGALLIRRKRGPRLDGAI